MTRRCDGFAVVLAVALLAAIVLLLLALVTLTRSELRVTARAGAASRARQNALVGLRVALGRLQAAAGPDACSTAAARGFGGGMANPHWTGVWRETGEPIWLVSGPAANVNTPVEIAGGAVAGVRLVGANTAGVGGEVSARYENLNVDSWPGLAGAQTVGRFAYWTGDEGVKGHVAVVDHVEEVSVPLLPVAGDPVLNAVDRARLRQLVAHRSGTDALNYGAPPTSGFLLGSERDPASAVRWFALGDVIAREQLRFVAPTGAAPQYRAYLSGHWHDFTVSSRGVLADAAHGGLRRNYSDPDAPGVPSSVRDLDAYRPEGGRLPVFAGGAGAGEAAIQIKPIITEWALDFVLYRESGGERLLVGCRLRLELWNPYSLPLARPPGGAPDFWVRIGGARSEDRGRDTGLPLVRVVGPAGTVGTVDLAGLLGPEDAIPLVLSGELGPGQVVVAETVVAQAWDSGLVVVDPTPSDPADDSLGLDTIQDAGRGLQVIFLGPDTGAQPLTVLAGVPSGDFGRSSDAGDWSVVGNRPFPGDESVTRLGLSYHARLDTRRARWADWIDPQPPLLPVPDLKCARQQYGTAGWEPGASDPVQGAREVAAQFANGELFAAGRRFTGYDFTVQRNLSIGALAQLSVSGERAFAVGNPWGGGRNVVFDAAFFNPVPDSWRRGDRLPNVRYSVLNDADGSGPTAAELGGLHAARFLGVEGAFNVNSVSPEAWTVLLGRTVLGWTDAAGLAVDLENPFFVFGQSAPYTAAEARAVRQFSDHAIQELAGELVTRIRARKRPFRSLAEFVNSGVLQEAIDAAGLNTRSDYCADVGGVPERWSAHFLTQAAVLNTVAPLLAVRSDTFTIRVAAEALNPALPADDVERVEARAWCEAVVQRIPEFVDATERAENWPPTHADNRALGRRFRVVAFRWLGPDDI